MTLKMFFMAVLAEPFFVVFFIPENIAMLDGMMALHASDHV